MGKTISSSSSRGKRLKSPDSSDDNQRSRSRKHKSHHRRRSPSSGSDSPDYSSSDDDKRDKRKKRSSRKITEEEIAQKKAMRVAKKLKTPTVSGYSNESNPFGDSNLNEKFVWRKKIECDVSEGLPLDMLSMKAEKKRQRERMVHLAALIFLSFFC
ncbi:hypothetical protein ACHQM5_025202 [Ranunculus cassubicifolius]